MHYNRSVCTGFDQQPGFGEVDVFDVKMTVVTCSLAEFVGTEANHISVAF